MSDNGLNMHLYFDFGGLGDEDITGNDGSSGWDLCDIVADVTVNNGRNTGTVKNRGSDTERKLAGLKTRSIDIEITHEPGDANFDALIAAYEAGDVIGVAAMDKTITTPGAIGLQMDVIITDCSQTQPLEDSSNWKLKLEPAAKTDHVPAHVTVSA
jgi:hypothetical protein